MAGVRRFEANAAVGATVENLTQGTFLERLGSRPELISIFGCIDLQAAAEQGKFTAEIRLGNVIVADRAVVPQFTAFLGPDRDKHLIARAVGAPFDLVQVRLFNGTATVGGVNYRFLIEATPL